MGNFNGHRHPSVVTTADNGLAISPNTGIGPVTATAVLDDLTVSGTYIGKEGKDFVVEIDAIGTPDTYKWSIDGGSTFVETGISATGSQELLPETNGGTGIRLDWGATTGHTLGDKWEFTTTVSGFSPESDDLLFYMNGEESLMCGVGAGNTDSVGDDNSGFGGLTLSSNTTGRHNTGLGSQALERNTTGSFNMAMGSHAMQFNQTGATCTAIGYNALINSTNANNTVSIGNNTCPVAGATYQQTICIGKDAMSLGSGDQSKSIAVGIQAMKYCSGPENVAIGKDALAGVSSGLNKRNVAIGYECAESIVNGADNGIYIGYQVYKDGTGTADNALAIGTGSSVIISSTDMTGGVLKITDVLALPARSSDPSDPPSGQCSVWLSDGTGSGADGDLMVKINNGSSTATKTIVTHA